MKIFLDTANIEEIRELNKLGIIDGVTTNPSLIKKSGMIFEDIIKEISDEVKGDVSAEVTATKYEKILEQARYLAHINKNIVIKIPIIEDGLKAVKTLSRENIKTNVTLIFSISQAILAAKAGATYVSPFIGRLDDIGEDGVLLVKDIVEIFKKYNYKTEVIAASIRHIKHFEEVAKINCDVATIPYKVVKEMVNHPLTDSGLERFLEDFKDVKTKGDF